MLKKIISAVAVLVVLPSLAMAEFTVSEYKYHKDILGTGTQNENFSFVIDSQIYEYGDQFFADLRVVDQDNAEIPYLIQKTFDTVDTDTYDKQLDIVSEADGTYVLDMGQVPAYHQSIQVITESYDFSRVVDVYGSNLPDDRFEKLTLNTQGELVAVMPGNNDRNINFKYTNYRYIKLVFSGKEGDFQPVKFTTKYTETQKVEGIKKNIVLETQQLESTDPQKQKILFTVEGTNTPVDSLVIHTTQKDFSRNITLYTANNKDAQILENNQRYDKDQLYWKKLYQGAFSEQVYSDEQTFAVKDNKKYYLAVIDNADNTHIKITGATATQFLDTVYLRGLDVENNTYKVYYGNVLATKPDYDTAGISIADENIIRLILAEQENNLLYIEPKEKITNGKPYIIYLFIAALVIILFWFVYKIMKETKNKDGDEEVDFVDKL